MDLSLFTNVDFFNPFKQLVRPKGIMFSIYETIQASLVGEPSFCLDLNSGTSTTLQLGGSDSSECPNNS